MVLLGPSEYILVHLTCLGDCTIISVLCLFVIEDYTNVEYLFLFQTFLLEGEVPVLDFLGIVFGHIYHHYKTTNVLQTPKFVINWYNGDNQYAQILREKYKTISSDFEM